MKRPLPWSRRAPRGFDHDAWTRRNSDLTPVQCYSYGLCVTCGGLEGLWWSFGDQFGYTPCPECTEVTR